MLNNIYKKIKKRKSKLPTNELDNESLCTLSVF